MSYWEAIKNFWNNVLGVKEEFYSVDALDQLTKELDVPDSEVKTLRSNLSSYLSRLEKKGICEVQRNASRRNFVFKKLANDDNLRGKRTHRKINKKANKKIIHVYEPIQKEEADLTDVTALELGNSIISLIKNFERRLKAKDAELSARSEEIRDLVERNSDLERQVRKCKERILELNNSNMKKTGKTINLHALQQIVKGAS